MSKAMRSIRSFRQGVARSLCANVKSPLVPRLPLPSTSRGKHQLLLALALSELVGNFNSEQTSPLANRSNPPDRWS
jgi:hypothetical protein